MIRGFADAVALFALPFLIYAVALLVQRRLRQRGSPWSGSRMAVLSLAGLALVLLGLLVFGISAPRHEGAYLPAHIEGGRLVPGELR